MMIERQYQMMADLEALSSKLNELLLTPHPQMDILDQVYQHVRGFFYSFLFRAND
ncbi:hypothetical protein ACEQPO_07090 [Bacillus sp. SL00103]